MKLSRLAKTKQFLSKKKKNRRKKLRKDRKRREKIWEKAKLIAGSDWIFFDNDLCKVVFKIYFVIKIMRFNLKLIMQRFLAVVDIKLFKIKPNLRLTQWISGNKKIAGRKIL